MAVDGKEQEHGEEIEELAQGRALNARVGVDGPGHGEAHLKAHHLPGQLDRGEEDAHAEDGDEPHDDLGRDGQNNAGQGLGRGREGGDHRCEQEGQDEGEPGLPARGDVSSPEQGKQKHQDAHPDEDPEEPLQLIECFQRNRHLRPFPPPPGLRVRFQVLPRGVEPAARCIPRPCFSTPGAQRMTCGMLVIN